MSLEHGDDNEHGEIEGRAREIRRLVVRTVSHAGAGHIGGPLSAADILAALYFKVMRIDPARPDWSDRDRFILSKGHSAIGWYAVLALRGYFPVEELKTFDAIDSRLQGHPGMTSTPGVDMSSGSLGQGLSAGLGMALGARLAGKDFHTWVMLGDGELHEGQVWEAAQVAPMRPRRRTPSITMGCSRWPASAWSASAHDGAVARVAGVNGVHWLRRDEPLAQNAGYGHFAPRSWPTCVAAARRRSGAGRTSTCAPHPHWPARRSA